MLQVTIIKRGIISPTHLTSLMTVIMFGPFGPNILSFVWISTLKLFYLEAY